MPAPKTALLVIDMLNDYFKGGPLKALRAELTRQINGLIGRARKQGIPVIWVRQEFAPDLSDAFLVMRRKKIKVTIKGTEGCRILKELDRRPEDHEIVKKRYSPFFRTGLDELLKKLKVGRLVIMGINTHAGIRVATIDAYQRDLDVIIPRDGVASPDEKHHKVTLDYLGREIAHVLPAKNILD
jgi:nicotinamidase-related amidase